MNSVEGPISFAFWQLMDTLGSAKPDPAAQAYSLMARSAYSDHLITDAYRSTVLIFKPDDHSAQRFTTAIPSSDGSSSVVPESGDSRTGCGRPGVNPGWHRRRHVHRRAR
ncbi:MAG TPA: hypothetical protein VNY05_35230 [Candidatus Acidoferrales bacterium]|nr:hypothetical protein [Candidatus Acidoferrales bacterium]